MDKNIIKETLLSLEGEALQSAREKYFDYVADARLDRREPAVRRRHPPGHRPRHAPTDDAAARRGLTRLRPGLSLPKTRTVRTPVVAQRRREPMDADEGSRRGAAVRAGAERPTRAQETSRCERGRSRSGTEELGFRRSLRARRP